MTQTQKYLRIYIRLQALLLCLILGAFGAGLAAERTRYIAEGTQGSAAQERSFPQAVETLSRQFADKPDITRLVSYLAALPAPYGCVVGAICSAWEWIQTMPTIRFVIVHK